MKTMRIVCLVAALSCVAAALAAEVNPLNADPAMIAVATKLKKLYPATSALARTCPCLLTNRPRIPALPVASAT